MLRTYRQAHENNNRVFKTRANKMSKMILERKYDYCYYFLQIDWYRLEKMNKGIRYRRQNFGYHEWRKTEHVSHGHCSEGCEHPQPFMSDGILICGRCWFVENKETPMVPCTPLTCEH